MIKNILIFVIGITIIGSCKKDINPSHTVEDRTIRINDNNYYYSLAIPFDYNEDTAYPIFVALHWGGNIDFQSGANFLHTFALEALEDFRGFLISPSCPEAAGWIHDNSESLIFGLINKIKTEYSIDNDKIVIGGYSMGGIGTWYYATAFSDSFKVAVPISSMPPNYIRPIKDIIPTYVIHGENDEVFSIQNVDDLIREVKTYGSIIRLVEIDNASHYETNKFINPLSESLDWIESYLE